MFGNAVAHHGALDCFHKSVISLTRARPCRSMSAITMKRFQRAWRRQGRRVAAAIVLLAYFAAMFGFPMPAVAEATQAPVEQSSPTQARACCCQTANDCRQCGCCSEAAPVIPEKPVRWQSGMSAMQCKGLSTLWVSSGVVVPPPVHVNFEMQLTPVGRIMSNDAFAIAMPLKPLDPPPRLCA